MFESFVKQTIDDSLPLFELHSNVQPTNHLYHIASHLIG